MIKPNEENPIYQKSLAPRGPAVPAAPAQVGTISADESGKSMKIMENPEPLKRKIHEIMENPEPLKILQIHGGGGLGEKSRATENPPNPWGWWSGRCSREPRPHPSGAANHQNKYRSENLNRNICPALFIDS